jgi:transposase
VKRTQSLRGRSERKSGGQPEHPGSTLEWQADPTHLVEHAVPECCGFGASLSAVPVETLVHQVHDLPALALEVQGNRIKITESGPQ